MELSNSVLLKINKLQNFAGNERTVVMEIMVGVDSVQTRTKNKLTACRY